MRGENDVHLILYKPPRHGGHKVRHKGYYW